MAHMDLGHEISVRVALQSEAPPGVTVLRCETVLRDPATLTQEWLVSVHSDRLNQTIELRIPYDPPTLPYRDVINRMRLLA
jgi:hypothetical protein